MPFQKPFTMFWTSFDSPNSSLPDVSVRQSSCQQIFLPASRPASPPLFRLFPASCFLSPDFCFLSFYLFTHSTNLANLIIPYFYRVTPDGTPPLLKFS